MPKVCIAHCIRHRAAPVSFVRVDEHPVNHILSLGIKTLSICRLSLPGLELCEHCQIAWQVVAVTDLSADIHSYGGAVLGGLKIARVSIDSREVKHCLSRHPKKRMLPRKIAPLFQVFDCFLTIADAER